MASGMAPPVPQAASAQRALPAGTRLQEYEIEGLLEQTSTALTYRAYDRALQLHVAIQEYMPDALALRNGDEMQLRDGDHAHSFERGRQAFVNEARWLAHCEHPSLPRMLRMLTRHGTAYRVMRCEAGPTLREYRRSLPGAPSAASARALLDCLLGALAELHRQGHVHGALSPDRIQMLADERPMLPDTGAVQAALLSDRTRGMMAALEPGFAPIEQCEPARERPLGPWTDLYSLAATLLFFIDGELPASFDALRGRLHDARPGATQDWAWLKALQTCLAQAAAQRPQSVAQLRALLDRQDAPAPLTVWAKPGAWVTAGGGLVDAGAAGAQARVAPAKDFADLQQSLPFVAARFHEVMANQPAPVVVADALTRVVPRYHRRRWRGGAARLLLFLMMAVAAGEWMRQRGDADASADAAPASALPQAAPQQATVAGLAATPRPSPGGNAHDASTGVAAAAGPASAAALVAVDALPPDSPRQRCGTRSGYALYQCMQAQCVKRQWADHRQCQRLRREQSLG